VESGHAPDTIAEESEMIWRTMIGATLCLCAACIDASNEARQANSQTLNSAEQCRLLKLNGTRLIKEYDHSKDGKLDRAEFKVAVAAAERMLASSFDRTDGSTLEPIAPEAEFKKKDLNSDGFIELSEIARIPGWVAGTIGNVRCL
jgi:hypothetical protein